MGYKELLHEDDMIQYIYHWCIDRFDSSQPTRLQLTQARDHLRSLNRNMKVRCSDQQIENVLIDVEELLQEKYADMR